MTTETLSVAVLDTEGKQAGDAQLPGDLFGVAVNVPLIHQVVVAQQAAARQGTHKTKTRGEVRGGGIKPYRQKGTGRARQGSIRAPQFTGGGVVHGPQPRDYSQRTPKKMKAAALRSALSNRAEHGLVRVINAVIETERASTKIARKNLEKVTQATNTLLVLTRDEEIAALSVRNLPNIHALWVDQLNTYDVMVNDDVVFTEAALQAFVEQTSRTRSAGSSKASVGSGTEDGEAK